LSWFELEWDVDLKSSGELIIYIMYCFILLLCN
jgi:hypothetical protein